MVIRLYSIYLIKTKIKTNFNPVRFYDLTVTDNYCTLNSAPDVPPAFADVPNLTGGQIMHTRTYTCQKGYIAYGDLSTTCEGMNATIGKWSNPTGNCQGIY